MATQNYKHTQLVKYYISKRNTEWKHSYLSTAGKCAWLTGLPKHCRPQIPETDYVGDHRSANDTANHRRSTADPIVSLC